MGYCNITQVESILANTLTSSSPSNLGQPVDLLSIGRTLDFNVIDTDVANEYIRNSDTQINGAISQLYAIPLCELSDYETTLLSDINNYNDYIITSNPCPFYVGDVLLLVEGDYSERHVISEILGDENNIFQTVDPIGYEFEAECTRILRLKYPDPISLMSARITAAQIYEKYFMAEASPSESEYGKWMRGLVQDSINAILNGAIILHGATRIGRRFYNPTLDEQYGLPRNDSETRMESAK